MNELFIANELRVAFLRGRWWASMGSGKMFISTNSKYLGNILRFAMQHDLSASAKIKLQAFYEQYKARKR